MTDTWPSALTERGARIDSAGVAHFPQSAALPSAGLTPLLREASILVCGEDAESFLQAQLSNDIRQVGAAKGQLAAYCSPKGRVLATFSIWPHDKGYLLRLPVELADSVRKRLQMYVLRSRVRLEDVSDGVALVGLAGAESVPLLSAEFGTAPVLPYAMVKAEGMSALALPGQRVEISVSREVASSTWDRLIRAGCTPAGQDLWDWYGIAAGIPTMTSATADQFIPQMLNLELLEAVAFDKGCYPGQEIVARSQYLGQVKRRLQRFASAQVTRPGATIHAHGGSAGTIVNVAQAPGGGYEILAVTLQDAFLDALHLEDGTVLTPLPLPYAVPHPPSERAGDAH